MTILSITILFIIHILDVDVFFVHVILLKDSTCFQVLKGTLAQGCMFKRDGIINSSSVRWMKIASTVRSETQSRELTAAPVAADEPKEDAEGAPRTNESNA